MEECITHEWLYTGVVFDTKPPMYLQVCKYCNSYRKYMAEGPDSLEAIHHAQLKVQYSSLEPIKEGYKYSKDHVDSVRNMTDIDTILNNIDKVKDAGAEAQVVFQVKDEGKLENNSIDVGPADFRATLKFSDFIDLGIKLEAYKKALNAARESGIAAPAKAPKEK